MGGPTFIIQFPFQDFAQLLWPGRQGGWSRAGEGVGDAFPLESL